MNGKISDIFSSLKKNKLLLVLLLCGILILILPVKSENENDNRENDTSLLNFSIEEQEQRLSNILEKIDGCGKVSVLLSIDGSFSRTLAKNGDETLILSGKGGDKIVDIYYGVPKYTGAVIVASGADDPKVKMNITSAVSGFTGLGINKIKVLRMGK